MAASDRTPDWLDVASGELPDLAVCADADRAVP